jgi:septum formation protein
LQGQHIWAEQVIAERFEWGKERAIYALAVRVYRLPEEKLFDLLPEYGGCKSWTLLAASVDADISSPVLSDEAFHEKLNEFRKALQPPITLASASPRRAELLREAGIPFEVHTSHTEELHDHNIPAGPLCELNAERKAEAVAELFPGELVLGADTLVTRNNTLYGKPKDLNEARSMLSELQGKTHQVITGVCLLEKNGGRRRCFHEVTEVAFRPLSPEHIEDYLQKVHVLDKAGAYAIQEHGDLIIEKIEGSWSNVVGLPIERLQAELRDWYSVRRN